MIFFVPGHLQGRHRDRHERFRLRGGQPGPPGGGGGGEPEAGELESHDDRQAQIDRGREIMMQGRSINNQNQILIKTKF